jgi:hypothetical protein
MNEVERRSEPAEIHHVSKSEQTEGYWHMKKRMIRIGAERHEATEEVPRESGRIILAHGETTGHAHAIASRDASLYSATGDAAALALGTRILAARASVALEHEEHSTIQIPRGTWGIRIQRQYEAGAFRRVED